MDFLEVTTPRYKEQLAGAIKQVSKLEPSLPDGFEDTRAFSHYGSGFQNNNTGGGTQNNNNGAGNQNNGSGQLFIGTNQIGTLPIFYQLP
jgi:alkaline phosphatase